MRPVHLCRSILLRVVLLLLVLIPILEILLLIKVGGVLGALSTLGLVVLTAALGLFLLRTEGLQTLRGIRDKLMRSELPLLELLNGLALVLGAVLLVVPGFITDLLGLLSLLPVLYRRLSAGRFSLRRSSSNQVIEGEYRRQDD